MCTYSESGADELAAAACFEHAGGVGRAELPLRSGRPSDTRCSAGPGVSNLRSKVLGEHRSHVRGRGVAAGMAYGEPGDGSPA